MVAKNAGVSGAGKLNVATSAGVAGADGATKVATAVEDVVDVDVDIVE